MTSSSSSSSTVLSTLKGPVDTLMIDNYDSFTYNLVQYLEELGADVLTIRNDAITVKEIEEILKPRRIIVSPGPGNPRDAGVSMDVIRAFGGKIPIFGVCLGLQCMYEVYGGTVTHAGEIMHGKTSDMYHDGKGVFDGIPSPFRAVRYHSLAGTRETLPEVLEITCTCAFLPVSNTGGSSASTTTTTITTTAATATTTTPSTGSALPSTSSSATGMIQGVRHKHFVVEGVQFHPESILTEHGRLMLKNFLGWEKAVR